MEWLGPHPEQQALLDFKTSVFALTTKGKKIGQLITTKIEIESHCSLETDQAAGNFTYSELINTFWGAGFTQNPFTFSGPLFTQTPGISYPVSGPLRYAAHLCNFCRIDDNCGVWQDIERIS